MRRALRSFAALAFAALLSAGAAAAAREPNPLFAADEPIRLTIRGPFGAIARNAPRSTDAHDASLALAGAAPETHPIRLSARGITRRRREVCPFPPLRVEFTAAPTAASLFRGQRRLKLVTHCRPAELFQQFMLLEYAAYQLLNTLSPRSLRVRLAAIDYVETGADRPFASRLGFLVEDVDDAARRNGLVEIDTGNIFEARLSPRDAARFAVFQYMIGNLDWSMDAGPRGALCCHNSKLLGAAAGAANGLIPIPYDFDHSGLVDAPYATPPPQVAVATVRARRYRGYCIHNEEARAAAAEALAARPALLAVLAAIPQLSARSRARASAYLGGFFEDVGSPEQVAQKLLRNCLR
ncbi:MAG TPA: hypothetical protein VES64_10365 [Allosphingosinicella sp.]|nr:hypothetical protein [Allosphingosinicella sp.]